MPDFKIEGENVSFWLRVKPRSTRERLTVDASGELRLELHAPATEGQANEACIHFFARALRLAAGVRGDHLRPEGEAQVNAGDGPLSRRIHQANRLLGDGIR